MAWSRSKSGGGVDGSQHAPVGQLHPDGVTGEEHPAEGVVQSDVVLGVAGRVHRDQAAIRADLDHLLVLEHVQPLGRRGVEPPVERVEQRPVDAGRRVDQPGRVGQVPGPFLVDVDGGGRERLGRRCRRRRRGRGGCGSPPRPPAPPGPTPIWASAASSTGTEVWLPVSISTGAEPSIRYPAVTRSQPPSMVSISSTPSAIAAGRRDGGDGLAARGVVHVQAGVGVAVRVATVRMRSAHGAHARDDSSRRR